MRAVKVTLLCAVVIIGAAAMLFFIMVDRVKRFLVKIFWPDE